MKLFHISHTDLDGYACQLITKELFDDVYYLNANYGLEVKQSIQKILDEISLVNKEEKILFLISDLNLTYNESKNLDFKVKELIQYGFNIKLQILDHHISGKSSAEEFSWYYLDVNRCASKIVYDYMLKYFKQFDNSLSKWLEPLIDTVNAVDIWLDKETSNFEFGKVLLSTINLAREINSTLFPNLNRDYRLYLLKASRKYLFEDNRHILLDESIYFLKKDYLKLDDKNDTIDNLSSKHVVNILNKNKDKFSIHYKNHKGLLTYAIGSISILANTFLKANEDYDFFIDVGKKGTISLRADGKVDVALMAFKLAKGGGHLNASGAKFEDFKETIDYEVVKKFMQNKLEILELEKDDNKGI